MSTVNTTPTVLGAGPILIQNLGPDDLYIGHSDVSGNPLVTAANGFRISTGESISVQSTSTQISAVSSGTSEVRSLFAGTGVYAAEAPVA